MTKTKFGEFVEKQNAERIHAEESGRDWARERDKWIENVESFYTTIFSYLREYIDRGQIVVQQAPVTLFEEGVGEYSTKAATLFLGKKQIEFEPIGTNLIGAKGRIDMIGPNGKVKFVLVDKTASSPEFVVEISVDGEVPSKRAQEDVRREWVWKISTPPPRIGYFELNEESFFEAMMEVANA